VIAHVLEHVEVAVASTNAEVVRVVAVPAVEEIVDLDREVTENEPLRSTRTLATLDPDTHRVRLSRGVCAPSRYSCGPRPCRGPGGRGAGVERGGEGGGRVAAGGAGATDVPEGLAIRGEAGRCMGGGWERIPGRDLGTR